MKSNGCCYVVQNLGEFIDNAKLQEIFPKMGNIVFQSSCVLMIERAKDMALSSLSPRILQMLPLKNLMDLVLVASRCMKLFFSVPLSF